MQTKTLLILIGVGVVLTVISTLSIRSCVSNRTQVVSPTQIVIDSVNRWESDAAHVIDSLSKAVNYSAIEKDSLRAVTEKQSQQLEIKEIRIKALAKEASIYKAYKDTANYVIACDSILPQIDSLTESVAQYRHSNKVLENKIMSIEDANSLANASKDYYLGELKQSFDRVSATALSLEKINKTLDKKASRRWSLAAIVGYGVNRDLKPDVFVGIGGAWRIARF